jgi:predicted peptidase
MKAGLIILFFIFYVVAGCTKKIKEAKLEEDEPGYEVLPPVLSPVSNSINEAIGGYYVALPFKYKTTSKKYPLLFFVHGGGQFGNGKIDLPVILNEGIPQLLDEKIFPPDFVVDGEHFSFIVIAPQFRRKPSNEEMLSLIKFALENYRVDSSRIYMSGMSYGGIVTCDVTAAYPSIFAAIVPISGVPDSTGLEEKTQCIAESKIPIWIFHNESDALVSIMLPGKFIESMNSYHPVIPPRFTVFKEPMGLLEHDAWTRATDPNYREDNKNIYEWMLSYHH